MSEVLHRTGLKVIIQGSHGPRCLRYWRQRYRPFTSGRNCCPSQRPKGLVPISSSVFCFASAIAATGQWRSFSSVAAGGFEAVQLLVGDRHAEVADAMVKGVGGAVGVSMGYLMTVRWSL